MGLKFKWFRARMSFKGGSPPEKYNTVTGIGYKQTSESLPTYRQISTEFTTPIITNPPPHGHLHKTKRELNPEIQLKIRSVLTRSMSSVTERETFKKISTSKSIDDITLINNNNKITNLKEDDNPIYNNQKSDAIINYEKRKAELLNNDHVDNGKPKSILKKTVDETDVEIKSNGNANNSLIVPRKPSSISVVSSTSTEPPPINYSTLPRNRENISKEWEEIVNPETDNVNSDIYESVDDDKPYVIEIQEPSTESNPYAEVNKDKKKKVISFEEKITEINDVYSEIPDLETKRLSNVSSGSAQSDNEDFYGNDYTNSKRTSYFQAGGATFSSQAASIFITNKKPTTNINERRPTAFVPRRASVESDASA